MSVDIPDLNGGLISQQIPLNAGSYALLKHYIDCPKSIPTSDVNLATLICARSQDLLGMHDRTRIVDPSASCGIDLNNFYMLPENLEVWTKERRTPVRRWNIQETTGFSELYLGTSLKTFAKNINQAYELHHLDPKHLENKVRKVAWDSSVNAPEWKQLRLVYITLRSWGYADRELTQ